jgi:uncharacterized repeat protein (TIGR02543 family)
MTQLEVLLVGGGGDGVNTETFESETYGPNGGGGGQVEVFDFSSDTSTPLTVTVGDSGDPTTVTQGATTDTALPGEPGFPVAGESGSGNPGYIGLVGGGGGDSASPATEFDGGPGTTPQSLVSPGSLFETDTTCYGGGGAVGIHGDTIGAATCGGGSVTEGTNHTTVVAPTPNSGGGGGAGESGAKDQDNSTGASGVVVVRWNEPPTVTLSFNSDGHGAAIAPELVAQDTDPTAPRTPTADGWVFQGWYTDASLTTKADFSVPLDASTTFFARWTPALATTGSPLNPLVAPLGTAALGAGLTLMIAGSRRRKNRAA